MGFESDIAAKEFFGKGREEEEKGGRKKGKWRLASLIGKQNLNSTVSEPVLVQKRGCSEHYVALVVSCEVSNLVGRGLSSAREERKRKRSQ